MDSIYRILCFALILCLIFTAMPLCASTAENDAPQWHFGFGRRQILPNPESSQPLYIAGYNSAWEIADVIDYCEARAVWMDTGDQGVLLIGIDCVALASGTVDRIRQALADVPGCASINVYATHTHAGADTLGLWGPVGISGKNDDYMNALIEAAVSAGREAAANRRAGTLYYGTVQTEEMFRDSRLPIVSDETLYQLRFAAADGSAGLRLFFYGAHAESLRGANKLLSRDFPGLLCDGVTQQTGDQTMFMPGAIGGLIMTKEFVSTDTASDAQRNLAITAEKLIGYALSITPEIERSLSPSMSLHCEPFTVPLDNPAFLMYKFLGILDNKAVPAQSVTGYGVQTELSILRLGDLAIALLPGEIFPELVLGGAYGDANPNGVNPRPLRKIAADYGVDDLLIIGLCNDEIGYIVPPSDFLLNEEAPYLAKTMDYKGENHYEETNSVGPACADAIAAAFEKALAALQ